MSILLQSKRNHPDFRLPRIKPVGPVKIDYSRPFARGIQLIDVFQGANFDMAGRRLKTNSDVLTWKAGFQSGQHVDLNGTTDFIDYGYTAQGIDDFTLIQVLNSQGIDNSQCISSRSGFTKGLEIVLGVSSDPLDWSGRMQGEDATDNVSALRITDSSLWHVLIWSRLNATTSSIIAIDEKGRVHTGSRTGITDVGTINSTQNLLVGKRGSSFSAHRLGFLAFTQVGHDLEGIRTLANNLYSELLKPQTPQIYLVPEAAAESASLTGTTVPSIDEDDITTGGKTSIITLTGDTWKAAGTGPIGSTADSQAIIDGFDAASSPTNGWNNEVRDNALVSSIVRTSSTVATITWAAQAGYDIAATETITCTVPIAALVTGAGAITASPTFNVTAVGVATPTVTAPATATSGSSAVLVGTNLETITTNGLSIRDKVSAAERVNTITAQPGDGLSLTINPTDTGERDLRALGAGSSAITGVAYNSVDISAAGITAYTLEWVADNGTNEGVFDVTVSAASGLTVVQTMIAVANTTVGESLFGTNIIAVEDDMQVVGPDSLNGMNITYLDDGTFTTDANQTEVGLFLYYAPSTDQWSIHQLTINQEGVVNGGIVRNIVRGIVQDIVRDIDG